MYGEKQNMVEGVTDPLPTLSEIVACREQDRRAEMLLRVASRMTPVDINTRSLDLHDSFWFSYRTLGVCCHKGCEGAFVITGYAKPVRGGSEKIRVSNFGPAMANIPYFAAGLRREIEQYYLATMTAMTLTQEIFIHQYATLPIVASFVVVNNSTPEPDGTIKRYSMRIPPLNMNSCQAIAWTFGRQAHGWYPQQET